MDKYEYKLKLDQMKSLAAEQRYEDAVQIADTINWRKIRNVNALIKAGEIYEKVGRYEDSKEILLSAYDKSPIGRKIIYHLAEIAIKTKSFDDAEEYYQEFVELAPHDNLKYILKYEIKKAQGADKSTLIEILEELKEKEYSEEWAYQLACLYHEAKMGEKCVEACDELILWFGDGPYVERALELKMLYQPLTKQQEEKYLLFRQKKEGSVKVGPEDTLKSGELPPEPVQVKDVEVSPDRFNTQNLQEELKKSMQQILNATEKEAVDDTMDNIKRLVEEIPYLNVEDKKVEDREERYQHIQTDKEIDDALKADFQEMLDGEDEEEDEPASDEVKEGVAHAIGPMSIEEVLAEWERTKRAAEAALEEAERKRLAATKAKALQEAEDIMERLSGVIPLSAKEFLYKGIDGQAVEDDKAAEMVANMNQILQKEIDRLSDENAQIDEQLAAAEAAADSEKDTQPAEPVFEEAQMEEASDSDVEELPADEKLPEIAEPDAVDFEWENEDSDASETEPEASDTDAAVLESEVLADTTAEEKPQPDTEEDMETAILAEAVRQMASEPELEQDVLPEIPLPEGLDFEPADSKENTGEVLPAITAPEAFESPETIHKLSMEQREIFTYFVPITGMEQQLCQALTGALQHISNGTDASTGNMIIQGGEGSGKTVLATCMIKALQKETGKPSGKVGKIDAASLNQKDTQTLLEKVAGGCLIIERVGELSLGKAIELGGLLQRDTSGIFIIIEDTRRGIEKALSLDAGFAARFSEKVAIPIFTSDELVTFAKSYANELGYMIEEMGVLALYNCISNIEHADRATTLIEVKDIVDTAIRRSEKGGIKKAFSVITSARYDKDDYVILREKDFDF